MSSHGLIVFGFLLGITLTVGVGVHAHNRGRSGLLWGLLTFFTGLIGAFIYALVVLTGDGAEPGDEEDPETLRVCPNCSTTHTDTPNYCSECGDSLGSEDDRPTGTVLRSGSQRYCSNCKSKVALDAEECSNCDAVL